MAFVTKRKFYEFWYCSNPSDFRKMFQVTDEYKDVLFPEALMLLCFIKTNFWKIFLLIFFFRFEIYSCDTYFMLIVMFKV